MKRNLIVVRAGNKSLHPDWIGSPEDRSWDLIVSYFGDDPDLYRDYSSKRIDGKGPKWLGLKAMLDADSELMDHYDFVWFPDDDLRMSPEDTDRFFEACKKYKLELAQPSLSFDSPVTHPLTLHNSLSKVRYTNFVEMMAPCFHTACLKRVLHTFDATESGWGIDWVWPSFVEDKRTGMGIVDEVVVEHTRLLGGPNYDSLREKGLSPSDELINFRQKNELGADRIQIQAIELKNGKRVNIEGPSIFYTFYLVRGYADALMRSTVRLRLLKIILGLARKPFKQLRFAVA